KKSGQERGEGYPMEPGRGGWDRGRRQAGLVRIVETPAMHGPHLPRDAPGRDRGVGRRNEVVVEPYKIEGRADPGDTRDQVQPAAEQAEPVEQIGAHGEALEQAAQSGDEQPPPKTPAMGAEERGGSAAGVSSPCSSCAATPTAIAAGHLLMTPSVPMGQMSRAILSSATPSRARRERNRAPL